MKTKQPTICLFFIYFLCFFIGSKIYSQNGSLIGFVDNNLVEIDPLTGSLDQLTLVNAPLGVEITNLAFSTLDCIFYGIIERNTTPTLVGIDWSGNYQEIGLISVPGETVYFCEALAYNPFGNKLYASVSLNGGTSNNDFSSETIIDVDPGNGAAVFKTELAPNSTPDTDIDDMVFIGNKLYFHDGKPGSFNTSIFYELDFQGLGAVANPIEILSTTYLPNRDMAAIGNQLFIATSDLGFYMLDIDANSFIYIDQTHAAPVYNGEPIEGLEYAEIKEEAMLNIDTTLCEGEELLLSIDWSGAIITWNTGEVGTSITINSPGLYWANIIAGNCIFSSDTLMLSTTDCSPCQYYIPNAFSPQQDGFNDLFKVYFDEKTCDIISVEMSIFDRWGELMFQSGKNEWDGRFKGKGMGVGVYIYFIKIIINENGELKEILETGDVTILK